MELQKKRSNAMISRVDFEAGAYAYDAMWTAALALDSAWRQGHKLEEFDYTNKTMGSAIYSEALNVQFNGASVSHPN